MTASAPGRWRRASISRSESDAPAPLIIVKWGGSLLTDKQHAGSARTHVVARLAHELAVALPTLGPVRVVLGHGSGSFGHVAAQRHGLRAAGAEPPDAPASPKAIATVQAAAGRLHRTVVDALIAADAAPFSLPPSALLRSRAGRPRAVHVAPLIDALDRGLLPVVYGDAVLDDAWGGAVCATETVLGALIPRLRRRGHAVRALLWLGNTDGILDCDGRAIAHVDPADRAQLRGVRKAIDAPAGTDVTGGMLLRLAAALRDARRGLPSHLLDGNIPGRFVTALRLYAQAGPAASIAAVGGTRVVASR